MENLCVMCGCIIPEGRLVCPVCEDRLKNTPDYEIAIPKRKRRWWERWSDKVKEKFLRV